MPTRGSAVNGSSWRKSTAAMALARRQKRQTCVAGACHSWLMNRDLYQNG
jgi:hypothetical protein